MLSYDRRLPVYLLLDCSGSMSGEPIEAVKQGIKALVCELKEDPQSLESAHLSVITFASAARQLCPLTPLMQFQEPQLTAKGTTALGQALRLLKRCIVSQAPNTANPQKSDWKSLAFLLSDGTPTDDWQTMAKELKEARWVDLIACAAGSAANLSVLEQITKRVILLNTLSSGDLARFFTFVSHTIEQTAQNLAAQEQDMVAATFQNAPSMRQHR